MPLLFSEYTAQCKAFLGIPKNGLKNNQTTPSFSSCKLLRKWESEIAVTPLFPPLKWIKDRQEGYASLSFFIHCFRKPQGL